MSSDPVFYFDVVCPYAYLASLQIAEVSRRTGRQFQWCPVLLGGIYNATKAPQGKDGSASDVMAPAKRRLAAMDLALHFKRLRTHFNFPPQHPRRSVLALRLILAVPTELRVPLAQALFKFYWQQEGDISSRESLLQLLSARCRATPAQVAEVEARWEDASVKQQLHDTTQEAVERGAPGVPAFWVAGRLFWGQDRVHFVERALGNTDCRCPRLLPHAPPRWSRQTLTFFYDFSSPWCYIGFTQTERIVREAGPGVQLNAVPILLGALFKSIGTPNLPMMAMSKAKMAYSRQDMADWQEYWASVGTHAPLQWPSTFPIRTVLPLRVSLVNPDTIPCIFHAAWAEDQNIGDPAVLQAVLQRNGFDGAALIVAAQEERVRQQLRDNTSRAEELGVCGVPTYRVNEVGPLVWGQDRLHIVQDLLAGWRPDAPQAAL